MDLSSTSCTSYTDSDESCNKEKRLKCNFDGCRKEFTKSRKLINHQRLHLEERPFACDVLNCNKQYTNSSHLRRHKKKKHDCVNERIVCTVEGCKKELANRYSLKKHILRCHNPQRVYPFKCGECQQGFYRKKELQQHSYLHTGELPFSCDECDKKFLRPYDRNRHKRIHKKYTCECGEIYTRWNSLRAHKKACLRNIKCTICEKTFSNKRILKSHINTHLDKEDRNFHMCTYDDCERYYTTKTNLTVHINNFHKKLPRPKIPCEFEGCNKLLSKMQNYKIHLRTHQDTNRPKFPRKPRKDKGIPTKSDLDKLCDIKSISKLKEVNKDINSETSASPTSKSLIVNTVNPNASANLNTVIKGIPVDVK